VRCSHPTLDRTERMFRRLTADTHCIGVVVEPSLHWTRAHRACISEGSWLFKAVTGDVLWRNPS